MPARTLSADWPDFTMGQCLSGRTDADGQAHFWAFDTDQLGPCNVSYDTPQGAHLEATAGFPVTGPTQSTVILP